MGKLRINFNKNVRMDLACAKDELRPALGCIYFKDGYAYASDAHILIKNDISEISTLDQEGIEKLDGKLLNADSYKNLLKYDKISISDDGIECTKGGDKAFFYFAENLEYPDAEKLIQGVLSENIVPLPQIGLDLELTNTIGKALFEAKQTLMSFRGIGKGITFEHNGTFKSMAIQMPCMINN